MQLPYPLVSDFDAIQQNFETIQNSQGSFNSGAGAPTNAGQVGDFYFRTDTPGVASQMIYVFDGTTWTGVV